MGLVQYRNVFKRSTSRALTAALMLTTSIGVGMVVVNQSAFAQSQALTSFSVPAGPLNQALRIFGRQAGLQVTYLASIASGKASPGVSGTVSREQALATILQGSGLVYSFPNSTTVAISQPATAAAGSIAADGSLVLETITIQGQGRSDLPPEYAGGQVATGGRIGMLGNKNIMSTPFNVTSYTSKTIKDQQATTIADVADNDPGVHVSNYSLGSSDSDRFTIRGFDIAGSEFTYNGLYGIAPTNDFSVSGVERVEILRGPNVLLNGITPNGGIGGAVNIVPKRATETPITSVTTSFLSDGNVGTAVDFGRRFGTNKEWGIRLNGSVSDGDLPVDDNARRLGTFDAAIDYNSGDLRASVDFGYRKSRTDGVGVTLRGIRSGDVPAAPDGRTNVGQDWMYKEDQSTFVMGNVEYDFAENWTVYGSAGASWNSSDGLYGFPTLSSPNGDVYVGVSRWPTYYNRIASQAGVRGEFETGAVKHELNISGSTYRQEDGWTWGDAADGFGYDFFKYDTNLYDPIKVPRPDDSGFSYETPKSADTRFWSFALSDTISLWDDRVSLTLGGRYQHVGVDSFNINTGAKTSAYEKGVFTPAVGLVIRPWDNLSFYANYIEGLTKGTIVGSSYANAGEVIPPYVAKQMEVGVKYDFGAFAATASLFEIHRQNGMAVTDANGVTTYTADGEQRNRGIELSLFGELYPGLRLLGGVTYTDARLTKTQGGLLDGTYATGVPEWIGKVGVEWDPSFVEGLTLTARMIAESSMYVTTDNQTKIPGWTRFDIGARYRTEAFGNPLTLSASVTNLFDNHYWASAGSNLVTLGAPRTFKLSATIDF